MADYRCATCGKKDFSDKTDCTHLVEADDSDWHCDQPREIALNWERRGGLLSAVINRDTDQEFTFSISGNADEGYMIANFEKSSPFGMRIGEAPTEEQAIKKAESFLTLGPRD